MAFEDEDLSDAHLRSFNGGKNPCWYVVKGDTAPLGENHIRVPIGGTVLSHKGNVFQLSTLIWLLRQKVLYGTFKSNVLIHKYNPHMFGVVQGLGEPEEAWTTPIADQFVWTEEYVLLPVAPAEAVSPTGFLYIRNTI